MNRPRYTAYRDSGISWLGEVPKHWGTVALRWSSMRYAGGTPDRAKEEYWEDGAIPWINSGAVNQRLVTKPSAYITKAGFQGSSAKWIPSGALVMALAGQGRTKGMVAQLAIKTTCNQSMAAIVPGDRIFPRYLYFLLDTQYDVLRNLAGGEQRDGLNLEIVGSLQCLVPPLDEQRAIAAFLDLETARIDALVEKKRLLIERLEEQRTALISRTVTRGLPPEAARAAGLDPSPRLKPSGMDWLGDVPEHWDVVKASRGFGVIGSGTTPRSDAEEMYDGDYAWVTTSELRETTVFETSRTVTDEALRSHSTLRLYPTGSLVVAMYGATIGRLGYLGVPAAVNQACCVFAQPLRITTRFFYYWLLGHRRPLTALSEGGGQPNLSQETLRSLRVPAPGVPEQDLICDYLDREMTALDDVNSVTARAIERLQEYRTALITAAVTGEIDLRDSAPVAVSAG